MVTPAVAGALVPPRCRRPASLWKLRRQRSPLARRTPDGSRARLHFAMIAPVARVRFARRATLLEETMTYRNGMTW